VEIIYQQYKME